jgi:ribosomal protein S18 acetylase RimI-like enzyme
MEKPATIEGPLLVQGATCEGILRSLPDWFGIEAAIQEYTAQIDRLPTFVTREGGVNIGFLTLKEHSSCAAEIFVMGVSPSHQRRGIGRRLLGAAEAYLVAKGIRFLQVKTLSSSHPDPNYARTRAFYTAMGFCPLEEFPELWDPGNPCLQMIKLLRDPRVSGCTI